MPVSLLNHTVAFAITTNITATETQLSASANQPPQWDAVAVYGFVFGLLAVLLAAPGTYLAIVALRRHRQHEAMKHATNDLEPGIGMQTSGMVVYEGDFGTVRVDGDAGK